MNFKTVLLWAGFGVLGIFLLFFACIFGALVGAFSGWLLSLTPLGGMVVAGFGFFGVKVDSIVSLGAAIGFVSGFFSHYSSRSDSS